MTRALGVRSGDFGALQASAACRREWTVLQGYKQVYSIADQHSGNTMQQGSSWQSTRGKRPACFHGDQHHALLPTSSNTHYYSAPCVEKFHDTSSRGRAEGREEMEEFSFDAVVFSAKTIRSQQHHLHQSKASRMRTVEATNCEHPTKSSLAYILDSHACRRHRVEERTHLKESEEKPSFSENDELTELSTGGPVEDSASPSDIGVVNTPSRDAQPVRKTQVRRSRICRVDGCTRYVVYKGLCISHGGGRQCAVDGCASSAKSQGVCWKHGGSTKCSIEGCENRAKSRGLCWSHGGGRKCKVDECIKTAVSNGLCWAHGGGKRCIIQNCKKPACERNRNLCVTHAGERLGEM